MIKLRILITVLLLPVMIISCGRQKETVQESTNTSFPITDLAPQDIANVENGDWIIKQIMSDPEKINPTVTNDATASSIITYIFENLLEIDRVTYELKPLIA